MKTKKILSTLVLGIMFCMLLQTSSQAALQSNQSGSILSKPATDWIIRVRQMESDGGGMGLNEVVGDDALATTESNGIDVHLQKNTEYGAIVLLGASDYGKQGLVGGTSSSRYMNNGDRYLTGTSIKASSTGNVTGVYELGTSNAYEWTAGGGVDFLSNIAPRYRDIYETHGVGKAGDATIENGIYIYNWHGGSGVFSTASYGFLRGVYGSGPFYSSSATAGYPYSARACVVSFAGL